MNTTIEAEKSGGGRLCFWLGIATYLTSFFLPSINRMAGWECATQSLSVLLLPGALANPFGIVVLLAGLANPAVVIYVYLKLFPGSDKVRFRFALVVLTSAISSGVFLLLTALTEGDAPLATFRPRIGYSAWICGMLLIIAGDVIGGVAQWIRIE